MTPQQMLEALKMGDQDKVLKCLETSARRRALLREFDDIISKNESK